MVDMGAVMPLAIGALAMSIHMISMTSIGVMTLGRGTTIEEMLRCIGTIG
jgi:hypothetical protein